MNTKTNLLKSIFISLILLVGGISKISAATVTFTADDILFFNMSAVSWWTAGTNGNGNFAYFFNNSTNKNAWSAHAVQYSGSIYYVKIPAGTWEGVILTRNNTSTAPSWDNKWNKTGNISLSSTSNYISKFSENSTSVTWGTQKPTSTGSLAASATSVNTATNVTLTPSLTSNTNYNEIKSTSYSISPSSGASISGNTFTATAAGTYTITATITYNPRGYSSLTSTVSPTVTITVKQPTHTVTFGVHSSGNGTLTAEASSTSISSGASVDEGTEVVFTATPSTGFQIEGWYSNSTCTTPIDNGTNYAYTVTITGGTNVYVKFEEIPVNSHNITYTAQATGWTYGAKPTSAEEGATVTFVVNPTAGYRVDVSCSEVALTKNGNNYTFTMPGNDVNIKVEAKPEQYTVTLNKQSGTGGPSSVTATYAAAMPTITPPTRTGYTFNGYFDAASDGTKYYNANGSSAKNWDKTSNTTLYAQWTANTYTVKFNANDGTGSMSNQSFTYDVEKALTANAFTRKGYTFLGWSKTSSGAVQYTDKQMVENLTATNNSTVNLYAVWQALPPTQVILKPNDQWKQANARYAIYYWGDGTDNNGWVELTDLGCSSEYFTAEVPASYVDFKFVRLDPNGKTDAAKNNGLHWDYKWNETEDLTTPAADENLYDMTSTTITHLYLKPNEWSAANAWFATYLCNGSEAASWHKMTILKDYDNNKEDIYSVEIGSDKLVPSKNKNIIFVRKDPSNTGLDWNGVWNQTADLNMPTDGSNFFSLNNGDWSNGTWSTIYDNSKWTTYTVPTYTININAPEVGSIAVTVDGNTTTVTNTPKQITNIAAGSTFTVAYTPNAGFKLGHSEVEGIREAYDGAGTYTVCGPVDITAHFVTAEDQEVYLRPNDNWLADNARFYAYAFNRYGDDEWFELVTEETDYTGAYGCTIPAGYSDVIFVRLNPTAAEPSWNDGVKWNQSVDYVIPVNTTTNRFIIGEKITAEGADKDKYQGSWEASDRPIYGIPGDWQGTDAWSADEYPLMGPDGLVTVNITQTNDTLGFKVYQYPYGSDNNSAQWLGNNGTMVRGGAAVHEGGWTMETNPNNCGLGVDVAGDYVFAFNIRNKKLTVTYPEIPAPTTSIESEQRVFEDEVLAYGWVAGDGTEANPYQLYADEAARITLSPIPAVEGLTAYYQFGNNEEQTSNVFDWKDISSQATTMEVKAYYKNAMGTKSAEATVNTSYFKTLALPFYLMTSPNDEINIDRVAAGENIIVQFRSDAAATVGLYVKIGNGEEQKLTDIKNTISTDYPHYIDNNIDPCVLHYIARSTATVHGRTFEAKADVAIYKNVIIKVNDPEGWVKNAYMWRDGSGDVLTSWPGDPVLQNYGTWRVFSVKYPYYDRFIVNNGQTEGVVQTISWEVPEDDRCYELVAPEHYDHPAGEDEWKYGLQEADCPENLLVEDIKDTTIMEGEQIVVMPKIFVGLGYQVADIEANVYYDNTRCIKAMMSGTNVTILGNAEGQSNVTVTYILDTVRIEKTFKVTVTKRTKITIQVKVPKEGTSGAVGWANHDGVYLRYWHTGDGTNLLMTYLKDVGDYDYYEADVPLDANGETNFHLFYELIDNDNRWRQTINKTEVKEDGCYLVTQDGGNYYRGLEDDGVRCLTDQYQVRIAMGSGKTFTSNIVTAEEDTLSFFAPGMNETGYKAGVIMLYQNDKMIATIEPSTFAVSNVYTATLNDALNGLDNVSTYSGNFYIRTWGTDGDISNKGWNSVQDWTDGEKASRTFTEFVSREGEFYNHYWVQAMNSGGYDGKDVSACVANDYNDDLAGKLLQDKNTNEYGDIKVGTGKVINVRFGYDPRTNYFGRAVLQGSADASYLNLHCDNAYADKECTKKLPYGNNTNNDGNKFRDVSNWVYERDVYVNITNGTPSASLYVEAKSPRTDTTVYNHLLGYGINEVTGEETSTPIQKTVIGSGTDNGVYKVRVVYDFKTNRIIAVWEIATDLTITTDKTVNADVLFIRKENEDVPQITLSGNGEINNLKSLFFAMELDRGSTNKDERHEEQYMFTLPFDCVVGSISGLHGYMELWGIQRYRGDLRAQKGWYAETATFWEWLTPKDTLKAGEGYLLAFDKKNAPWKEIEVDKKDANGNIIEGQKETISMIRLYFPSIGSGFDLQQQSAEQLTVTYPNHPCTLTLHDRYLQDSNWKMIGTTSYNNATVSGYVQDNDPGYEELEGGEAPKFRYTYSYEFDNNNNRTSYTYAPELGGEGVVYKSFYGYMVQFAGTITWNPINETVPEPLAAPRRAQAERSSVTMRLELANTDGKKQDQTFVALDENGTTTFDQNKDLNKVFNSGKSNIYTLSEGIPFAGNTLPMGETLVPVGVQIATEGEYTFRMPDGTEGMVVELIDYEAGTTTNMLLSDYTVTLSKGTHENRFALHVQPEKQVGTGVGNVGDEAKGDKVKGIEKYLIDGKLVIRTAEGAVYDAQGHVVQ